MNVAQTIAYVAAEFVGMVVILLVGGSLALAAIDVITSRLRKDRRQSDLPTTPYISCAHGPGYTRTVRPSRGLHTGEGEPGATVGAQHLALMVGPGRFAGRTVPDDYFTDTEWAIR